MKRILLGILLLKSFWGFSQQTTQDLLNLSIQQALDLGLKNRYDIKSKAYDAMLSQNEISKSKKEWIPEVSAAGNIRYSPDLQATYIPGGFFSPEPSLTALGAKSMSIFGLDLNQPIFKPSIKIETEIAKNNTVLAQEKNRQYENKVKEQILLAYLNVNLKKLQYEIATNEEQRFKEYANLLEGKYKLGTLIENDYLRAKLDYENAKNEAQKAKQNHELALLNVKYQINVPVNTVIIITDTLNSLPFNKIANNIIADVANRTEIKQLMLEQEGLKLELTKIKQATLPTVSFIANYSKQFSYNNFDYTIGKWWSTFNYIGVQFKIPITASYKNQNNIQEQKFKILQNDLDFKQKIADVDYEVQKVSTEVANAQKNIQVTKNNYELSKTIYNTQKQQYGLGSWQYSDLLETDRSLHQAEQNYIKAVYDYLIATVNYQKAIGVL